MTRSLVSCLFLIISASGVRADQLAPGMPVPAIRLADQHDVSGSIGPNIRIVLFTRDMDAGDFVKEALADKGDRMLAASNAVYVSDISGMPGVIAKLFALPSMRKRPYRMLLDRDGKSTSAFPAEEGKVTVLRVANGKIERVEYLDSAEQVRAVLNPQ